MSPSEVRARIVQARKLPDDPVAAVHQLLTLPPATIAVAPFLGNRTAILASPQNVFAMAREPNCSLTAFNTMYTFSAMSPSLSAQSQSTSYEQTLHATAGLTTTADQFAGGCKDPGVGVQSNKVLSVGLTPSQFRVGALIYYNSQVGNNALNTVVTQSNGTLVGVTAQPAPTGAGAGMYPIGAVSGDVNKDGISDIITINQGFNSSFTTISSISVYLGKADGSFTLGQSYTVPQNSSQTLVVDDFNGDGILDVVVPSAPPIGTIGGSQINFYAGKGDGTFAAPVSLTLNSPSGTLLGGGEGLVSGDFNGDGKKDLISSIGVVLLGKGDGTFTQVGAFAFPVIQTSSNQADGLAVGDFNKDGMQDVAVGNGASIYVFLGNGDGTFTPGSRYAAISNQGYLTATDLDGDGNLDLYSGDATNGIFGGDDFTPNEGYALMGNGDGTFRGAPQTSVAAVRSLEDLNGDGKLDYVAGNSAVGASALNTLAVYLGNGDGTFKSGAPVTFSPFSYNGTAYSPGAIDSFALADVNGDGHLDLVLLPIDYNGNSPARQGMLVALGNSNGTFQTPTFTPFPSLIPSGGQDYLYTVSGLFAAKRADGKTELMYSFLTQDFNNATLYYQGYATLVVNGDGTFGAPVTTDTYVGATAPTALVFTPASYLVDLNGDKTPDVIQFVPAVYANGGVITSPAIFQVFLGKTDGTFAAGQTVTVTDMPNGPITVADVNGDGKPDLLSPGQANNNGEIGVALGNGDGTFQGPKKLMLNTLPNDSPSISVGDFDGDGKADLVILGFQPPYDSGFFAGNGDGTFQSVSSGANNGTVAVQEPIELYAFGTNVVTDINGDGKPDIVGPTVLINQFGVNTTPVKTNSTTTLSASPTSISAGQTVTLTATVAAASGGTVPTGTVTFLANGTTTVGTATLNAQGVATLAVSTLAAGSQSITAGYGGDSNFNSSTSSTVAVTVAAAKTNTVATIAVSSNSIVVGQSVMLTATVTGVSGSAVPTGTVTFLNHGTTALGTGTLNAQGVATLSVNTLAAGSASISASYGGDSNFNGSTSGSTVVTVTASTKINSSATLSASPTAITVGQSLTLTSTVTAASGSVVPTGTVTFLNGATTLGTGTLNAQGVATLAVSTLTVGSQSITASYGGDSNFNGSTSSAVMVTVSAVVSADFSLGLSPSSGSLKSGASTQSTVTITPVGGFSQAVTLTCSGLPTNSTCGFGSPSLTPAGAAVTTMVTINTGVISTAQTEMPGGLGRIALGGFSLCGLIGLALSRPGSRYRRTLRLLCLLVLVAAPLGLMSGCGGGSHSSSTTGTSTPSGTYTVSVTGTAGSTTHSASFTLTVQ